MAGFLNNLSQVRAIEWGASYLWDIKLEGAPAPFSDWFPATDVDINNITTTSFVGTMSTTEFKSPMNKSAPDMSITYLDDEEGTLHHWFEEWLNSTVSNEGVLTLAEAVKTLHVIKYRRDKSVVYRKSYLVYPDGGHPFKGTSSSEADQHNLNFNIAGKL